MNTLPSASIDRDCSPASATAASAMFSALAVLAACLANAFFPVLTRQAVREDGPVETLTVICLLGASIAFVAANRCGWSAVWCLGYAGLCFVVAGEELSWGQRLLGFETPAAVKSLNVQGEFTLHNMPGLHTSNRVIAIAGLLAFAGMLPWYVKRRRRRGRPEFLGRVPLFPPSTIPILAAAIALMGGHRLAYGRPLRNFDEPGELLVAIAMLVFGWYAVRHRPAAVAQRLSSESGETLPGTSSSVKSRSMRYSP